MSMRPKHSLVRLPTPKTSGHDLMGNSPVGIHERGRHARAQGFVPLEGGAQDRRFPLNGSRMIKIDSGVRSILLAMPSLGARPGWEVLGSAAAGVGLDCSGFSNTMEQAI
jgi:hypothetical protein